MSIWLIVEASSSGELESRISSLQTAYLDKGIRSEDLPDEDEKIGSMRRNNNNRKAFTGTSRATLEEIADLADGRSWLAITTNPAFMRDAEWE
jgi:hypothetical protein